MRNEYFAHYHSNLYNDIELSSNPTRFLHIIVLFQTTTEHATMQMIESDANVVPKYNMYWSYEQRKKCQEGDACILMTMKQ